MKKMLKKIKKFILQNKRNLLLVLISLVAFIIGSIAISPLISFIIIAIIDLLLFLFPIIYSKIKENNKTKNKNKTKANNKGKKAKKVNKKKKKIG